MDIELSASSRTPMSALDPRVKLIGVIAFSVVTASLETLPALAAALVLSLGLVALARMRLRDFLMRLAVVNLFIVFLWLFLPWSMSGERLFSLGPLQISDQGVSYSLLLTVRSNALVIALMALMSPTSIVAITHAMSSLRVPDKL
ncbi:MAG: CbiQ family ECF transporter T component, partial [Desulfomonilia bacterium]